MNRQQYYAHRRELRMARPRGTLSVSNMAKVFEQYYSFILNERDQATYDLIGRYKDRASYRLHVLHRDLESKGKAQGANMMRELIYRPNPLLALIGGK